MGETALVAKPDAAVAHYRGYWIAWFVLLIITVLMVFFGVPSLLIFGMSIKASIIVLLYMHLWKENWWLIFSVVTGIFATALILFLLILSDAIH